MPMNLRSKRIVVTGGAGFVGRVICNKLRDAGCEHVLVPRHDEFDLTDGSAVERMYAEHRPQIVIHAAAQVGGIGANMEQPGRFFFANMAMGLHLIEHARLNALEKFVLISSICAYPKMTPVPFREEDLWNGYPEETNAPYGIAKKAAMVMLDAYHRQYGLPGACLLPVNTYGPGDNFDLQTSHVVPAIIRKCVEAVDDGLDEIVCWGSGEVSREFLYVDDFADAVIAAAERVDVPEPINVGTGREITIRDLVKLIAHHAGFEGEIRWDASKPDGQPRRCLDISRAEQRLEFRAKVDLEEGIERTVEWYRSNRQVRTPEPASSRD